jgi:hypothetical protein
MKADRTVRLGRPARCWQVSVLVDPSADIRDANALADRIGLFLGETQKRFRRERVSVVRHEQLRAELDELQQELGSLAEAIDGFAARCGDERQSRRLRSGKACIDSALQAAAQAVRERRRAEEA